MTAPKKEIAPAAQRLGRNGVRRFALIGASAAAALITTALFLLSGGEDSRSSAPTTSGADGRSDRLFDDLGWILTKEDRKFVDYGLRETLLRQQAPKIALKWYRKKAFRFRYRDLKEMQEYPVAWEAYGLLNKKLAIFHTLSRAEVDQYRQLSVKEVRAHIESSANISEEWPHKRYAELHKNMQLILASGKYREDQYQPFLNYLVRKIEHDRYDPRTDLMRRKLAFAQALRDEEYRKAHGILTEAVSIIPIDQLIEYDKIRLGFETFYAGHTGGTSGAGNQ